MAGSFVNALRFPHSTQYLGKLENSEILGVFGTENYFRLASTFNASLLKLTGDEQKAVKTKAFDLQLDLANPGMSFHKLDKAKDKN